jgi:hypothetical protein
MLSAGSFVVVFVEYYGTAQFPHRRRSWLTRNIHRAECIHRDAWASARDGRCRSRSLALLQCRTWRSTAPGRPSPRPIPASSTTCIRRPPRMRSSRARPHLSSISSPQSAHRRAWKRSGGVVLRLNIAAGSWR